MIHVLIKLQIWSRCAKININLLQPKMYYTHNINLTLEKTIKVTSNPYETWNKQNLIHMIQNKKCVYTVCRKILAPVSILFLFAYCQRANLWVANSNLLSQLKLGEFKMGRILVACKSRRVKARDKNNPMYWYIFV